MTHQEIELIGQRVIITNQQRGDYGKVATVTDLGLKAGIYVLVDGETQEVYLPFGWEVVR